jgi:hypothetical protein
MRVFFAVILAVLIAGSVRADVVVNEVMANEPGTNASAVFLEWIELYNPSSTDAHLQFHVLVVNPGLDSTWLSGTLAPGEYFVFCRDSVRFEEHWGDSSGIWGDDPASESYRIDQLSMQLRNDSGGVALFLISSLVSELSWTESGRDGCSWERVAPTVAQIGQSIDPSGSTPGRINSLTPMPIDLALDSVQAYADTGLATLAFHIANRGRTTVSNAVLELYEFDAQAADSLGDLIAGEAVGSVDSGYTVILVGQYRFPRYYQKLVAAVVVLNDDRPNNNRIVFTAPGSQFPPVILSEFLANPTASPGSEWVELKNISDTTINLAGWQLGDSIGLAGIASAELLITPNEYLVLVQDSADFLTAYPTYDGRLHQPPSWRGLNNGSDSLRLFDAFDIQADRFYYTRTFDSAHTWARSESPEYQGRWGRSEDACGTPGEANRVRFLLEGTASLEITIDPRIISPDGDGHDDSTIIRVQASDALSYTLKLYDSQGRLVRTLEDEAPDLKEQYVWRGENDGGRKLPIGIYILYFEASGVESAKKTIVVAR